MPDAVAHGDQQQFVTIAKVVRPQGRRGEVAAALFTDFPERFEQRRTLYAWFGAGERRELQLEEFWAHKGDMILKFAGVDSIDDAEQLSGAEIQIPRNERAELEEGAVYVSDLAGCAAFVVSDDGLREIGTVADVDFGAGAAPLLVVRDGDPKRGGKEYLIPFVEAFTSRLALQEKRIELKLPDGMLELDAPLSAEEKQAQQRGDKGE